MTFIILALLATVQTVSFEEPAVIRKHGVGPVSLGVSAESVYKTFRGKNRLVDLKLEGHLSPALELTFPKSNVQGGVVAELLPHENTLMVWRISVTDPGLRTEKGIGVGSSVDELRAAYRIDGIGSGEGRAFVRVEELAASFEIDWQAAGRQHFSSIRDQKQIPGDVKVLSVLLTR